MRNVNPTHRTTIERLEPRAYLSVPPPVVINGTDGPDTIYVFHSSELVQVYVNPDSSNYQYIRVNHPKPNTEIRVLAKGGNDRIQIEALEFGGSASVDAGAGNDQIIVGGWGTYARDVDGPVAVIGGDGNDLLTVDDSKDSLPQFDDKFTVTDTYIGWGGTNDGGADFSRWEVEYDASVEFAKLKGPNDKVRYDVRSTSAHTPIEITAGNKADRFTVGNGDVDSNIRGNVSLLAGAGSDSLFVNDATDDGNDTYRFGLTRFDKTSGGADVNFYQFEAAQVDGNLDDDTFRIEGISQPTTIRGSGGADFFDVGMGTLKFIRHDLTVDGQAGEDRVAVNDAQSTSSALYDVAPGLVHKSNVNVGMIYTGAAEIVGVVAGGGDDVFNVTPALGTTYLLTGGGQQSSAPGDRLNFSAGFTPNASVSAPWDIYRFAGRSPVQARGFETKPVIRASIGGTLFNDKNHNGQRDNAGEQLLGARTVYLDLNNNGKLDLVEPWTKTNGEGKYLFQDLLAGTFKVRQILPDGWTQTSPQNGSGRSVTVAAGEAKTGNDFGSSNHNPPAP